jgi:lipopolysaccharide export system protein LptA
LKNTFSFTKFYLGAAMIMLLFPATLFSQNTTKIDLVNANSLEFDKSRGENVKRLIGNVVLLHEGTYMYCDSAYLYDGSNSVDAYGNVKITSTSVTIKSDVLYYDGESKIAQLDRNVKMTDGKMVLTTDHLTYNTSTDIGNYYTGGRITDPENVLTSKIGYYYAQDKQFFFKKDVVLVNPRYTMKTDTMMYNTGSEISYFYGPTHIVSNENHIYCENGWYDTQKDIAQFNKNARFNNKEQTLEGDSLYYDRITGFGKAFHNIKVVDTTRDIILKGDYAEYYEKDGKTMITDKALLIQDIDGDSLFLHADTLKAFFDTCGTGKTLYAYRHAKFFKSDLQGSSDSIVYSFKDSTIFMFIDPMLWSDVNQLSADTVQIFLSHNKVKQMNLYASSFIIIKDDSIRFNQVKGKNLVGHFVDNELRKINVYGNCETHYYVRDDKNKMVGVNKATSENLLIFVKDNEIKSITFLAKPEASLYPEKDLSTNETQLKGFKWEEYRRPASPKDVFH